MVSEEESVISGDEKGFNPIPSMFTLCNGLCGFIAIATAIEAHAQGLPIPPMALWMVCGAMLFDVLDGLAARVLDARSMHGLQLDSLSDAVSFGAAPAAFIYCIGMQMSGAHMLSTVLPRLLAGLYLACTLWRLAAYNSRAILGIDKGGKGFVGLPSPAAAGMVCCMVWLLPQYLPTDLIRFIVFVAYTLTASLLMVSNAPYPHLRNLFERVPVWMPAALVLLGIFLVVNLGAIALVLLAHIYILSPPLAGGAAWVARQLDSSERPRFIGGR